MAKVTEQDLIKLGFKRKWFNDKSSYWFEINFKHPIFKKVYIHTSKMEKIYLSCGLEYVDHANKPLTTANLDLFIRFAKGEKL